MSNNPWPAQAWPNQAPNAQQDKITPPFTDQYKKDLEVTFAMIDAQQAKVRTLNDVLVEWDKCKINLAELKEREMELRKEAVALGFGKNVQEGVNKLELGNGYELKASVKYNYKLIAPEGFIGDKVDAVDECIERFTKISNEGSFIAERLFKFDVDMSITEYRKLVEEAEFEPVKAKLLAELNRVLLITEAAPTLEIKAPKGGKT